MFWRRRGPRPIAEFGARGAASVQVTHLLDSESVSLLGRHPAPLFNNVHVLEKARTFRNAFGALWGCFGPSHAHFLDDESSILTSEDTTCTMKSHIQYLNR